MTAPSPRHIAHAIADLARGPVVEAWRYLDAWDALEAAGVPVDNMRDALDIATVDTHALTVLRDWAKDGARGLLCLHGAQDCGKTYAQALWVLDRHKAGKATLWVNAASWGRLTFDEIRPLLRRAERADALVVDDAGAGMSQGPHFQKTMEALLLERGTRPTVVSGNLNDAEMTAWLGGRITSRLQVAGGRVHIERTLAMRTRETQDVDAVGRGPRWYAASRLVSLIGCERSTVAELETVPDEWGGTYERPTGGQVERFDVGRDLEVRVGLARTETDGKRIRLAAARAAGLDLDAVRARASELVGTASDLDGAKLLGELAGDIAAKMQADNLRRAEECTEALHALATRPHGGPDYSATITQHMTAPAWATGAGGRAKLAALGFTVDHAWDGYAVLKRCPACGGDRRKDCEACDGAGRTHLGCGAQTESAAWLLAARLCGTLDPATSVSMADASFRAPRQLPDASAADRRRASGAS